MREPPHQPGAPGHEFFVHTQDGDIIVISTTQAQPSIPDEKARNCPQCGKRAWLMTRHCWHCGFDFGRRCKTALARITFLAAVANLAAAGLLFVVLRGKAG